MSYALVTFDVYSALFDIEGSLVPVVGRTLGDRTEAEAFVKAWRRDQMTHVLIDNALGRGRTSFRHITALALEHGLAREGIELPSQDRERLVEAWDHLIPWPEAADVLGKTRQRVAALALLSNGDQAMLEALAARLPDVFDHVFSAEAAGVYKPAAGVYQLPLDRLRLAPDDVLHIAGSATDALGATAAGLACAWVNRHSDSVADPQFRPRFEIHDLNGVVDLV